MAHALRKVAFVAATVLAAALFSAFSVWAEAELDPLDFAALTYYCVRQIPLPSDRDWVNLKHLATHTTQRRSERSESATLP